MIYSFHFSDIIKNYSTTGKYSTCATTTQRANLYPFPYIENFYQHRSPYNHKIQIQVEYNCFYVGTTTVFSPSVPGKSEVGIRLCDICSYLIKKNKYFNLNNIFFDVYFFENSNTSELDVYKQLNGNDKNSFNKGPNEEGNKHLYLICLKFNNIFRENIGFIDKNKYIYNKKNLDITLNKCLKTKPKNIYAPLIIYCNRYSILNKIKTQIYHLSSKEYIYKHGICLIEPEEGDNIVLFNNSPSISKINSIIKMLDDIKDEDDDAYIKAVLSLKQKLDDKFDDIEDW